MQVEHLIVVAGHYVSLPSPHAATIELDSIAASLSKLCRFGGHCGQFYSVAEHCWWTAYLAEEDGLPARIVRSALMHDATEAYLGDVIRPLKRLLPGYRTIERQVKEVIERKFDVDLTHPAITRLDLEMLKLEKRAFFPDLPEHDTWGLGMVDDRDVRLACWSPETAQDEFLRACRVMGLHQAGNV